jgi:hypothetical protein
MTLSSQFVLQPPDAEFEKFTVDLDVDSSSSCLEQHQSDNNASLISAESHLMVSAANNGNIRRHTVGPGDVAHEQALNNPATAINFKFDGTAMMMGPNQIPINLPMLLNQPINTFTVKDQHLLKPPMEMGASEFTLSLPTCTFLCDFTFQF